MNLSGRFHYFWGAAFSIVVIGVVLLNLDWGAVIGTFSDLNWVWLGLAFLVYLINYLLRTLRFQSLLKLHYVPFHKLSCCNEPIRHVSVSHACKIWRNFLSHSSKKEFGAFLYIRYSHPCCRPFF
ncbi:MAG: hypothetical protein HC806_02585 [Anaerolineae bacterium]|nr:hypothetical protein [Anaerolineae bacterium]